MARKYEALIRGYCSRHGVEVPLGFGRNTPGRYVVIHTHLVPPELTAVTWSKTSDVLHHIQRYLVPEFGDALESSIRILDFKEDVELAMRGNTLKKIAEL